NIGLLYQWGRKDPIPPLVTRGNDFYEASGSIGTEVIPDIDWKWMDRNLGALTKSITASEWNRNIGLLYQWGRKDPIPPLVTRGNDFYEASGSIG
ncbi:hypothetical protein, partial [Chryseobacterium sp. CH1]|uniref:hypothetical protein n=1 Tax=Chryseobacterium sp. CH1 TaxID=713551 RepID=UPI0010250EB5